MVLNLVVMILLLRTMSLWWKDVFSGSPLKVWRSDHRGRGRGLCALGGRGVERAVQWRREVPSSPAIDTQPWPSTINVNIIVILSSEPPHHWATFHRRFQRFAIFLLLLSIYDDALCSQFVTKNQQLHRVLPLLCISILICFLFFVIFSAKASWLWW